MCENTEKMILYKEVLLDLVQYAEREKDRDQLPVVVELFKNRFKRELTLIRHADEISTKIFTIETNLL